MRWLLASAMVLVGVLHFVRPEPFLAIMPEYLPWHLALVLISGAFEILGGIGLLIPRTRSAAGWGLIALYVAVFPANLHMALNPEEYEQGVPGGRNALYARLPVQLLFIAWAWAAGIASRNFSDTAY